MRLSLQREIDEATRTFASIPKEEWIGSYAQQVVLVIDQLQWTH